VNALKAHNGSPDVCAHFLRVVTLFRWRLQALLLREWQEQQVEWRLVERKLQATIARLQAQAQDAADGREQALQRLEEVTLRLKAVEREAADVTSLYRDAKASEQPQSLL
jgi:hypothetical protein